MTRMLNRRTGFRRFVSVFVCMAFLLSLSGVGWAAPPEPVAAPSDAPVVEAPAPTVELPAKAKEPVTPPSPKESKVAPPVTTEPKVGEPKAAPTAPRAAAPKLGKRAGVRAPVVKKAPAPALTGGPATSESNLPLCAGGLRIDASDLPGFGQTKSYTHTFAGQTITITVTHNDTPSGPTFDWTSSWSVYRVVAKGGAGGANVYAYSPPATHDEGLHCPINPSGTWAGISHIDFCFAEPAQIKVYKYEDLDRDGSHDEGEPYLSGWTIELLSGSTVVDSEVTDSDGEVKFDGVAPGAYTVREVLKHGWKVTTDPYPIGLSVGSGDSATKKIGNARISDLTVYKFEDKNLNGERDEGEPLLDGWEFSLSVPSHLVGSGTTSDGKVVFEGLDPGTYSLDEIVKAGWFATTSLPLSVTMVVGQDQTVYVGNASYPDVRVHKYNDLNGNGRHDEGEPPLEGWEFSLSKEGADPLSATSGSDGVALFENVLPASYMLDEILKDGWYATTALPMELGVAEGQDADVWVGNAQKSGLTVMKFHDVDLDAIMDAGEPPLAGWTFILKQGDATIGTALTDVNGMAVFSGLMPGSYSIEEVPMLPWYNTTDLPYAVTIGVGESPTIHVGNTYNVVKTFELDYPHIPDGATPMVSINGDLLELTPKATAPIWSAQASRPYGTTIGGSWLLSYGGQMLTLGAYGPETLLEDMTNDFTYDPFVGGHKFNDLDGDGEWDEGEPGLDGWTINLYRLAPLFDQFGPQSVPTTWELYASTVTADGGHYSFLGLPPGEYKVEEVQQDGWAMSTTAPSPFAVSAATNMGDLDFGNHHIDVNKVWRLTYAGAPDGSEFSVEYTIDSGAPIAVPLASMGEGIYEASVAVPWGSLITGASWYIHMGGDKILLGSEVLEERMDADKLNEFTYTASVSGFKFEDLDGNGLWDEGEVGLPGWTIGLYVQNPQAVTPAALPAPEPGYTLVAQTVTAADGSYGFSGLPPGVYYLAEDQQPDWIATHVPDGPFKVGNGTALTGMNFGNQPPALPLSFPDVAITKSPDDSTVTTGQVVTYTLNFWNHGEAAADGFTIVDDYDERYVTVVDANGGVVDASAGTITWAFPNDILGVDEGGTLTYKVKVKTTLPSGTINIDNVVVISTPGEDDALLADPVKYANIKSDNSDAARIVTGSGEPFLPFTGVDYTLLGLMALIMAAIGFALVRRARMQT